MRRICVFTGSRAEYGLLQPLMAAIQKDPQLQLQLLVSGSHLSDAHGATWRQIEADGFPIDAKVDIGIATDSAVDICRSTGLGLIGYSKAFAKLQPDLLVLLGDRYEAFAAASAAALTNLPVAHLHGGELTRGAIDDALRHAISKLSLLHFTATAEYRRRVIQLGEAPERVFNVGAIGLDGLEHRSLLTRAEVEEALGLDLGKPTLLVTYHPVTTEPGQAQGQVEELLAALDQLQLQLILTGANADAEGNRINRRLADFAGRHPHSCRRIESLGQQRYLSALRYVAAVVGNSSSGIIEAPSFGRPTVNIGSRQDGRLRAASVIDCAPEREAIVSAVREALSPEFVKRAKDTPNPYRQENTTKRILQVLAEAPLRTLSKVFFDLPASRVENGP